MANVLVEETSLSNIASAIRGKNGSTAVYKPGEMAAAITNLPTGSSSGGNDDGFLMDTLVNYENTTATKIKNNCFNGSTKLVTGIFPNVSDVGTSAFSNCSALTQVSLPNVISVGSACFLLSKLLSDVNLSKAETLGKSTFQHCESLTSINLPQVNAIGQQAFQGCTKLEKVDLRKHIDFLDYGNQFTNCTHLTTLILRSNTVCSPRFSVTANSGGILSNTPIANSKNGYVYVPRALVNEYKNATNWTVIADQIRAIEDYPEITGG